MRRLAGGLVFVLGGLAIEWTHDVALIYAAVGVLTVLIPFCFSFTALGHAERYIPAGLPTEAASGATR